LKLRLARLFRILRIRLVDGHGRGYAADSGTEDSAAVAAADSGSNATAAARSNSAAVAGTDAGAAADAIRWRSANDRRLRISQVREIVAGQLYLWRHHHCGFCREFGVLVAHHNLRRRDLFHRGLGQFALGSNDLVAI